VSHSSSQVYPITAISIWWVECPLSFAAATYYSIQATLRSGFLLPLMVCFGPNSASGSQAG